MASSYCRICGRFLSNPLSVRLGIDPICRADTEEDYRQGELDFMNAYFDVLKHETGKYIFIRDIGHHSARSVTNDAEFVIKLLYRDFEITGETRVFYEDSEGQVDELLHEGWIFKGFKAGHEGVEL